MSQLKQIRDTLKQVFRQQGLTYKDIAERLNMSEANIKRMFSTNSFSLERLEDMCHVVDLNLIDLFLLADQEKEKLTHLTREQEQELIDDHKLFLVAVCVRDSWTFKEIISKYAISEHEGIRLLARLDKLKMIQLLPNNAYKLLIAQDFRWISNGPLERFMEKIVLTEFMNSRFNDDDSFRFYLRGHYSQSSIEIIRRKLNQLTKEAATLNHQDASLPLEKRRHTGLLLALRPWEISIFESLAREPNTA
ncbi:helix-turn-helix domain-containing protein [Agarivorans sp. MS3-6]|uniref:helix-turn-helix domain-containing protein n=1 Tax=Agarivorans sp. TSD2052 TaxID=2937286 RepID=UPI00200E6B49|nr:helix-turn-helix transcriptional regulator [Agarivorans sp. TSD2052]UPW19010.1 helix-turn-helix domain-containing protein [Agarivorans sp. TSD2052]